MPPVLARNAIETYSAADDLIVDPRCKTGTVIIEAIHAGRRAAGITHDASWARLAHAGVRHARHLGASGRAAVIRGDACDAARLLAHNARHLLTDQAAPREKIAELPFRRVALILTMSPRRRDELGTLANTSAGLLTPGGFLVLANPPSGAVALCARAGLVYWQHVIALTLAIRDGRLQARSSAARCRHTDIPRAAHQDVLVFRYPESADQAMATTPVEGAKAVAL